MRVRIVRLRLQIAVPRVRAVAYRLTLGLIDTRIQALPERLVEDWASWQIISRMVCIAEDGKRLCRGGGRDAVGDSVGGGADDGTRRVFGARYGDDGG